MALEQGDSQVSQAPEASISAPQDNMASVSSDNQVGVCTVNEATMAANDKYMTDLGFPSANMLDMGDQQAQPQEQVAEQKPDAQQVARPEAAGDVKDLSPENQQRLNDLTDAFEKSFDASNGSLAATQKGLQEQADKYGTNPDGSPKVSVLAHQTSEKTPETNFYATFNNSRTQQETNQLLLEGARQYGDPKTFPSSTVGHIGTVWSRAGTRL